jgi:myo-inositol-1(or 4)-monophosphatase
MAATPPLINIMIKAAEVASKSLIRDFGEVEHLQVSQKSPANFVSAADTKAEEIIYQELYKAYPNYSFKMEERGEVEGTNTSKTWHVDPLDGTHNFIHGIPHWCTSIALEDNGKITAGVIFDPIKDELFWAAKGLGAFVKSHRRLRVSDRKDVQTCLFTSGAYSLRKDETSDLPTLQKYLRSSMGVRRTGSTALDLAYVAAGRYDAFWGTGSQSWDVAAGIIIIQESGGQISSLREGKDTMSGNGILASSAAIHHDLLSHLKIKSKS